MQSFTDTEISRRMVGVPEAQALIAIVLDPQKRCQPHSADNLFIYSMRSRFHKLVLSMALAEL
jgi:hypothetical protein